MANATIVGNLCRDPEVKELPGGTIVTNVTIAESEGWGDRKVTTFWRCGFFGKRGVALAEHCKKGDKVEVRGAVYVREYPKQDGSKGWSAECDPYDWKFCGSAQKNPLEAPPPKSASVNPDDEPPF